MRSRLLVCAALASLGLIVGSARAASAADPKAKSDAKSKKSSSGEADDKGIGKTLQWEDKVMGPDDKRGELDKILRAQAINKAATEKAERDKEKADKERAAREAKEAAAPKAQTTKKGGEVALPSLPDEGPAGKSKSGKSVEISPKLDTAAAAAPPPAKPADDKFIDKLLKEEGSGHKKKAVASDDKSLLDILSADKPAKAAPKAKGKKDGVDSLLLEADKEPAMAAPKVKHETPEWQKPEIQSTPVAAPVVARPVPKRDDGVIHVVQGAAMPASRATSITAARTTAPAPAVRRPPAAAPPAAARGGNWNDPFADGPRKSVASRSSRDDDDVAPAPRRNASSSPAAKPVRAAARTTRGGDDDSWDDPFDAKKAPAARRATAPAAKPAKSDPPGRWKDPFTDEAPAKPARGAVAMRESGRSDSGRNNSGRSAGRDPVKDEAPSKWNAAAKRSSSDDSGADDDGSATTGAAHGRWGVLKKRAH